MTGPRPDPPRVIIIGGGFAGLAAAKALRKSRARILLIDRRNHHVFQPLLYQVATAALSPADIATSIRRILRRSTNTSIVLAEPSGIDLAARQVRFPDGIAISYDYLILAAGATHSYFGHDNWATLAPGLKTIEDATELRRRILLAFESAEYEGSDTARRAALTFAIIGGGPTGVELAGAIKEIAAQSIPRDFRFIDTTTTRVVLLEGADRLLTAFPSNLSDRAKHDLERMGVEVRLNARVTDISPDGIRIGDEFLSVRNVFWAAGVQASQLTRTLGVPLDPSGRVLANHDLSIPGHPEVLVAGDIAAIRSPDTNQPVPGVAPAAIQMGRYAGRALARELAALAWPTPDGKPGPIPRREPFIYNDKGTMATIGRAKAVAVIGQLHFGGFLAWLLWGCIHIAFLITFRNRFLVMFSWILNWFFFSRDARLITGPAQLRIERPLDQPRDRGEPMSVPHA
ncbi:MAG: NAD(P)/FAD-dependent oxidoreductase [Phycisphaerales bacterium]|nr:NAD(P)/FAD-dependent oxidoreductase [Phycisphaerales bacterium]